MLVRVILLDIRGYGPTFLAEDRPNELPEDPSVPAPGFWGRLHDRRRRLSEELDKTTGWFGRSVGRVWRSMQRLVSPDEHLLRSLRKAGSVLIDHSTEWDPAAVDLAWKSYLRRKMKKHGVWLVVDSILAPASILLMFVPGPNVVGYWVFYRAIAHGLVFLGARRAIRGVVALELRPMEGLDGPISSGDHERLEDLARKLSWPEFGLLVERIAPDLNAQ